jgi:hypothetical protein
VHWLSVDNIYIQRRTICEKDYDIEISNIDVLEDDDVSFSMDEDLVGLGEGGVEGSFDDNKSVVPCTSEDFDGSESDSSVNSDERDVQDDDENNDEYWEASRSDSDGHIAKRQQT